jgi:hypothetical protein
MGKAGLAADRSRFTNRSQPAVSIGKLSFRDSEILTLDALSDGSRLARANLDAVDGADRCDFRGGTGKEQLVSDVEELTWHQLLAHIQSHVARDGDD